MRKSVSSDYNIFARAAGKTVHWKVSIKKTASLSEAQSAGTWIDVTPYLDNSIPDNISDRVELLENQFTATTLTFKALDIAWWKANIFDALDYLELKVEFWINDLTEDIIIPFAGWIDKKKDGTWCVKSDEETDNVEFTVASYLEYAARTSAMDITTQIFNNNVDGTGLVGLRMEKLPGLYVSDANITNYQLKKGVHIISMGFTSPDVWTASLDGGLAVELPSSDGTVTLGNGETTDLDTERITCYIIVSELISLSESVEQKLIQKILGDTHPHTWYTHIWIFQLLKQMLENIGIVDFTFDNFRINTYDNRRIPSVWEIPPGSTYYDKPTAIALDNENNILWIGIKDRIYSYNLATHVYTLIDSVSSGYVVVKLWSEDCASGFIWGVARNASGSHVIIKIVISTSALTTYSITRSTTTIGGELNFAIDLSVRGIYYLSWDTTLITHIFLLDTLTEESNPGPDPSAGSESQDWPAFCDGSNNYYYQIIYSSNIIKVSFDGEDFNYTTMAAYSNYPIQQAAYCIQLGAWIGARFRSGGGTDYWEIIKWDPILNNSLEDSSSVITGTPEKPVGFIPDEENAYIYAFTQIGTQTSVIRMDRTIIYNYLDAVIGEPLPVGCTIDGTSPPNQISNNQVCYDTVNDRIIGFLSPSGILFEHGSSASMYIDREADFEGDKIFDAMKEVCIGFQLMPRIGMNKSAVINRRFDNDGDPVTTGNVVTLDADVAKNISEETGYGEAYDVVTIDNGEEKESYDADGFDAIVLGDAKELPINSRFIPTVLLKDYAFLYYKYHSKSHTKYAIPTALIPYLQYEPFDAADLDFSGKINTLVETVPKRGIIVGQSISRDGSTEFEVEI